MAPTRDNAPLSDTEGQEKPVREQLKKASIAGMPEDMSSAAVSEVLRENGEGTAGRGRLQRKRSFEEVEDDQAERAPSEPAKQHTRKRSRDSKEEDREEVQNGNGKRLSGGREREAAATAQEGTNGESMPAVPKRAGTPELHAIDRGEATVEAMASPKTKRSRLHSAAAEENGTLTTDPPATETTASTIEEANAESTTKVPPTSGFANVSATSPFGALAGSKSPTTDQSQTSASAFASSGFGSLTGASSSGFGSIGKSAGGFGAGGGFGTGSKSPLGVEASKENETPSEPTGSAFGGALGQKSAFAAAPASGTGFGSGASGFGKLGGNTGGLGSPFGGTGFGSLGGGGGGGLSSFASGKPSVSLSGALTPGKAFGASADEDEGDTAGDEEENTGFKSPPLSQDEDKQDERFYAQHLETGEEDEMTEYSCRAKLYAFAPNEDGKKEWRERGLGVLRLNVRHAVADDPDAKVKARLLIRADGSHRVVLNTPVKKEINFGAATGGPPQGGLMLFMGSLEGMGGLELLQLKVRQPTLLCALFWWKRSMLMWLLQMKQQFALELHEKIQELKEDM